MGREPTLLGAGDRLLPDDLGAPPGDGVVEHVPTDAVTHVVLARKGT